MEQAQTTIRFHGTRGTLPRAGAAFAGYGGDTACLAVHMGGEAIFLDAGSGIANAALPGRPATVLLSHAHIDHILGLPFLLSALEGGRAEGRPRLQIYLKNRCGRTAAEQLAAYVAPPLWPAPLEEFPGAAVHSLPDGPFSIGPVRVDTMEGCHPGGCTVYRLSCGGQSLVYCTDFEHAPAQKKALVRFADGCDLLVYDAQFTNEEYHAHRGWGHSTWETGEEIARRCGAKAAKLFHHSPHRTDDELDALAKRLTLPGCSFAKQGEEVAL